MRRLLSISLVLLICLTVFVVPAYAAETTLINGLMYPRNWYTNQVWTGINADSLRQVESFKLSIHESDQSKISTFYVNAYFTDGAFSVWAGGYDSKDVCLLKYNNLSAQAANYGYDIENLTGIEVFVNSSEDVLCVIDVQEEAGFVGKIIDAITSIPDAILGYFEEKVSLLTDIFGKFINLISNLFKNFSQYTLDPVTDFLSQIDTTAINVWLSLFSLPMMSEIMMISVVVGLFAALISFLKSRS